MKTEPSTNQDAFEVQSEGVCTQKSSLAWNLHPSVFTHSQQAHSSLFKVDGHFCQALLAYMPQGNSGNGDGKVQVESFRVGIRSVSSLPEQFSVGLNAQVDLVVVRGAAPVTLGSVKILGKLDVCTQQICMARLCEQGLMRKHPSFVKILHRVFILGYDIPCKLRMSDFGGLVVNIDYDPGTNTLSTAVIWDDDSTADVAIKLADGDDTVLIHKKFLLSKIPRILDIVQPCPQDPSADSNGSSPHTWSSSPPPVRRTEEKHPSSPPKEPITPVYHLPVRQTSDIRAKAAHEHDRETWLWPSSLPRKTCIQIMRWVYFEEVPGVSDLRECEPFLQLCKDLDLPALFQLYLMKGQEFISNMADPMDLTDVPELKEGFTAKFLRPYAKIILQKNWPSIARGQRFGKMMRDDRSGVLLEAIQASVEFDR